MTADLITRPDHVPEELVIDVDPYEIEGGTVDHLLAWSAIQAKTPDLYYSRCYGGFWIVNRASLIGDMLFDFEHFSSTDSTSIPPITETPPFPPLYIDPPLHTYFRKPLQQALGGQNPKILAAKAREIITGLIDKVLPQGECEFMHDFALHVPVAIVLHTLDLPFEDRTRLIPYADTITHSSDAEERSKAMEGVFAYADEWVTRREQAPGDDLISKLAAIMVDDRPITHTETTAMVALLLLGGLDSVSHTMGAIMRFLAQSPEHQRELAARPEIIPTALNELLRRHSVNAMARTVTQDMDVEGVQLKKGDKVYLAGWLHGLDPQKWDDPLRVDFDRKPEIMTFGRGVHTCVGMSLARLELRTLLEEWFARIPSFSIKPGEKPVTMTGQTLGTVYLPLTWPAQ